jgi:hypothetical protein
MLRWTATREIGRARRCNSCRPAVERPAIAQINVDLNGRLVRVQSADETMRAAVEHACDRLRIWLERAARSWAALRGGLPLPEPGEWRHESMPAPRQPYFPCPREERVVMRHKSYTALTLRATCGTNVRVTPWRRALQELAVVRNAAGRREKGRRRGGEGTTECVARRRQASGSSSAWTGRRPRGRRWGPGQSESGDQSDGGRGRAGQVQRDSAGWRPGAGPACQAKSADDPRRRSTRRLAANGIGRRHPG